MANDRTQYIKVKWQVEGVEDATRQVKGLTDEEKALLAEFRKVNSESKKANDTIQNESKKSSNEVKKLGNSFGGLGSSIKSAIGIMAGFFAISKIQQLATDVINVTGEFQRLEAVLTNTLGSQSAAQRALLNIQNFAAVTPFGVTELASAYVKLANQGFKPTTNELRKLGDLAASTGKSFDQLTEAIIDAQTGEFERLKEFGIRASKEGDKVKFTFKGVEEQVDFTSASIQKYILSLGELEGVSGSMAAISQTLEGQLSNLGDSFDQLFLAIGDRAAGSISRTIELIAELVDKTTELIRPLEDNIRIGLNDSIGEYMKTVQEGIDNLAKSVSKNELKDALAAQQESLIEELREGWLQAQDIAVNYENSINSGIIAQIKAAWGIRTTDSVLEKLVETQVKYEEQIKAVNDVYSEYIKSLEKTNEVKKKTQKELDKLFNKRLEDLNKLESIAVREKKLEYDKEKEIYDVRIEFNNKKLALIKEFNKQSETIFKEYSFREKEIEREKQDFLIKKSIKWASDYSKAMIDIMDKEDKKREESLNKAKTWAAMYSQAMVKASEEAKQITQESVNLMTDIFNGFHSHNIDSINREVSALGEARDRELEQFKDSKEAQEQITKRYNEREKSLKRQAAISEKNNALFNIAISTAQNIAKAAPNVALMALAGASGAAQAALVQARPIPYNKGTKRVPGVGNKDTVPAILTPGEAVLPADKNKQYGPAFAAMFDGSIPASVLNNFVLNYGKIKGRMASDSTSMYNRQLDDINRSIKGLKTANINLDKNGFTSFMKGSTSKTTIANNYFNR